MAVVSGTQVNYDLVGKREQLSDRIYMISPEKTPFLTGAGKGESCQNTYVEWMTETLADPDGANAKLEGNEASFVKPAQPVRVGNYCQISDKTARVSDTTEYLNLAGRKSEMAKQIAKRAKELKRDQETILLSNQGAVPGDENTPRKLGSILAWIKTNTDFNTVDGADPVHVSGAPLNARTDGTQRPFTKDMVDNTMQSTWEQGGEPNILMLGAYNKRVFSGFDGVAQKTVNVTGPTKPVIAGSVDFYVSDFGVLRAVPNRFMRPRDALLLDFELVKVRYLRPHKIDNLAKTGDAHAKLLVTEYTLQVDQEAGLGGIFDLTTSA